MGVVQVINSPLLCKPQMKYQHCSFVQVWRWKRPPWRDQITERTF